MADSPSFRRAPEVLFTGAPENLKPWQAIHQAIGYIEATSAVTDIPSSRLIAGLLRAAEVLNRPQGESHGG